MRLHRILGAAIVILPRTPGFPAQTIPVRQVAPPSAATTETFGGVLGVKELPDGRVIIDDGGGKRLLLFDAKLSAFTVVSDTMPGAKNPYGDSPATIIPYLADSTFFLPWSVRSFLVIDPKGEIVRTAALPKAGDLLLISGSRAVFDTRGQLYYRARPVIVRVRPPSSGTYTTQAPDSSAIVRANMDMRTVDTIAYVRTPVQPRSVRTVRPGEMALNHWYLPTLSMVDDWTITSDGTLAIVRGHDYHIDWITPDGKVTSTPKMPIDWRKFTDDDKQHLADSTVAYWHARVAEARARDSLRPPRPCPPNALCGGTMVAILNQAEGSSMSVGIHDEFEAMPFSEMPDFYPPVRGGTMKADLDGNVWILPNTSARSTGGGIVYDVVNRKGLLVERVEMPPERSIVDFGPHGAIYMMWRDSTKVWRVERTNVVR